MISKTGGDRIRRLCESGGKKERAMRSIEKKKAEFIL